MIFNAIKSLGVGLWWGLGGGADGSSIFVVVVSEVDVDDDEGVAVTRFSSLAMGYDYSWITTITTLKSCCT